MRRGGKNAEWGKEERGEMNEEERMRMREACKGGGGGG